MNDTLLHISKPHELHNIRKQPAPLALVPTMGALHQGHIDLIKRACQEIGHEGQVWVSIFVNPKQFNDQADLTKYPRTLQADIDACKAAGATGIFTPTTQQIYPNHMPSVSLDIPCLTHDLEGAHRPGHFQGVCQIVASLFNLFQPDIAIFGKKDYQQWRVIQGMVQAMHYPIEIIGHPTVYQQDGLALSSRNRHLSTAERQRALAISRALTACENKSKDTKSSHALEETMRDILKADNLAIDYATIRCKKTLRPVQRIDETETVALITAKVGNIRLLDNRELT